MVAPTPARYVYYFPQAGLSAPAIQMVVGSYELGTPVVDFDAQTGIHQSVVGDFVDFGNASGMNVIEARWQAGYMDWINLIPVDRWAAAGIAGGCCDAEIEAWARAYAAWQNQGGGRISFIVPFPEMNGTWTSYGYAPSYFKSAWARVRAIFDREGATAYWIFAPNGWSAPPFGIRDYYPGDDLVDAVALSGFNWGACVGQTWQMPQQVFGPYIAEVRGLTNKPLWISQIGTSEVGGDKGAWLSAAYAYFLEQRVRGAIYFSLDKECNWAVTPTQYRAAITRPGIGYTRPWNLKP